MSFIYIANKALGKVIDIAEFKTENGTPIYLWDNCNGFNQQWRLCPIEEKYVMIKSEYCGKTIDIEGEISESGRLMISNNWGLNNQKFLIQHHEDESITFFVYETDFVLAAQPDCSMNGAKIVLEKFDGNDRQLWNFFEQNGDSGYLQNAKKEIVVWEKEGPSWLAQTGDFILWPATKAAEMLIPPGIQDAVAKSIEAFLLVISKLANLTFNENDIKNQVVREINIKGTHRNLSEELEAIDRVAREQWNWGVGLAATQGGAMGALGIFGLPGDIPALFTIVLRMIQQISVCYGYDPTKPEECDYILHILRTGSAGDIKGKVEALMILKQFEQVLINVTWKKMSAELAAKQLGQLSLLAALREFAKSLGINLTKRKALQLVPVIGAIVGASFNGTYANDVGKAAYLTYRRRWIAEHEDQKES